MSAITPFLWFDSNLAEALDFYTSVFTDSKVIARQAHGDQLFAATFELNGQRFSALNGGPGRPFTEAVSFVIDCADQSEVDYYWARLAADGGKPGQCGWLTDRFGLSWQVVPGRLFELLGDPDPARAQRATAAMLTMSKIDIAELERAADNAA